ncbi:DUF2847 family protein [Alkaliphilus pronyensis]|uniref:DUF2847 family protein n=1 Tax=Alkaliphilus pronyensis TaxID=1482732 RepID=A0A6I0F563_9FIRM|nr:monothiol bacilliredoxin BrxC family protein [Alkaliphilus pronyensis]KAB3534849.1 DUF2847 family protein [Alkaliphilus pronyensis]
MAKKLKKLTSITELEKLIKRSNKKPVFIFKHDDKLQESEDAYQEYVNFIEDTEDDIVFTVVFVREDIELSEAVEELLEVTHDVPQLILVMDEEVVWDDIKDNINSDNLIEVIDEFLIV